MLRNIPNKYTQEQLTEEIHEDGFDGTYNFFYLPIDTKTNANVGYAFVNFNTPDDLTRFTEAWDGHTFKTGGSKKIAKVVPSVVQGLEQNVKNLVNKKVAQGEHAPIVLRDGVRMSISEAAKEL